MKEEEEEEEEDARDDLLLLKFYTLIRQPAICFRDWLTEQMNDWIGSVAQK